MSLFAHQKSTLTPRWYGKATKSFINRLQKYVLPRHGCRDFISYSPRPDVFGTRKSRELIRLLVMTLDPLEDRELLLKLLYISKDTHREAEKILYRNLGFGLDMEQHRALLNTLVQNPRLARLVCKYEFRIINRPKDFLAEDLLLFRASLPLMVNLQVFRFTSSHTQSFASTILGSINSQLHSLYWRGCDLDERYLREFLTHQISMTKLDIIWNDERAPPPRAVPYLRTLIGGTNTIKAFLPGRLISRVYWCSDSKDGSEKLMDAYHVLPAFKNVRTLSLDGHSLNVLISRLAPYLTSLEVLELKTRTGKDLPGDVHLLPKLRTLVLSKSDDCVFPAIRGSRQAVVNTILSQNHRIDRIDIAVWNPIQVRADWNNYYYRWTRQHPSYVILSAEDALLWKRC
ncbi:hypothetical protein CVT24_010752 [Panaeolus cyanescens]|uniref:F-box domain-containing protein n=1 Tax=Panaeolus cyanescens TaxID=181874 RepID=A0A409YNM8_9AGAR|nr:hypothetical protein CVT24_010752 [Panaeolus cyanescens]